MQGHFPQVIAAGIYDASVAQRGKSESAPRLPSMFEIELPLSAGGVSYIDGEQMPISPDTLICARAGQSRHTRFPFRCYYLHMTVTEGLLYETLTSLPSFIHTEQPTRYFALFERIVAGCERGEAGDDLFLMSDVLALVANLKKDANLQLAFTEKKAHTRRPFVTRAATSGMRLGRIFRSLRSPRALASAPFIFIRSSNR